MGACDRCRSSPAEDAVGSVVRPSACCVRLSLPGGGAMCRGAPSTAVPRGDDVPDAVTHGSKTSESDGGTPRRRGGRGAAARRGLLPPCLPSAAVPPPKRLMETVAYWARQAGLHSIGDTRCRTDRWAVHIPGGAPCRHQCRAWPMASLTRTSPGMRSGIRRASSVMPHDPVPPYS